MKYKIIILFIISLILIGGFFVYFFVFREKADVFAKSKHYTIDGKIVSINKNEISLEIDGSEFSEPGKLTEKSFLLAEKIAVFKYSGELKSEQQFNEEQAEYNKKMKEIKESEEEYSVLEAPSWNQEEKIQLKDLKEEDAVILYYYLSADADKPIASKIIKKIQKQTKTPIEDSRPIEKYGKIKELQTEAMIFDIYDLDPAGDAFFKESLSIQVNQETKIVKKRQKSEAEYIKENDEFIARIEALDPEDRYNEQPPSWFEEEIVVLKDLSIGDEANIIYSSKDGAYIASEIEVLVKK